MSAGGPAAAVPSSGAGAGADVGAAPKGRYRLSFTEEMKGFFTFGEADCRTGFDRGRATASALKFHLTIAFDDTYAFVTDPVHRSPAAGYVQSDALGGRCPVERGEFNLFVDAGRANGEPARQMRYRLWFRDGVGHPLTLSGFKDISHPAGRYATPADVWKETTTLYFHLSSGFLEEGGQADGAGQAGGPEQAEASGQGEASVGEAGLVGAGILHILPLDFAHQLSTFRVRGPGWRGRSEALGAFGGLFVGTLWDVFRPRRRAPATG